MTRSRTVPGSEAEAVLRSRASALARRAEAPPDGVVLELLAFTVAGQAYAVETRHVTRTMPLPQLTEVPGAPAFLPGIINVRGVLTAALDIRRFLELPAHGLPDLGHLILVRSGDLELALLVDTIVGVRPTAQPSLQPALAGMPRRLADHLIGLAADHLLVLDVEGMLVDPRLRKADGGTPDDAVFSFSPSPST